MPKHPTTTTVTPYDTQAHLITTPKQARRLTRKLEGLNYTPPQALGNVTSTTDTHTHTHHLIIWINTQTITTLPNPHTTLTATAAHEATHAAAMLLDHIGQTYDGTSEALAYLVEWFTTWILTNL